MDELELKPACNSGWFAGIVHRPGDDQVTQKVRRCLPGPQRGAVCRGRSAARRGVAACSYRCVPASLPLPMRFRLSR